MNYFGNSAAHHFIIATTTNYDNSKAMEVSLNAQNPGGFTLLNKAAVYHNRYMIEELLKRGAYVNISDNADMTPLHYAVTSYVALRRYEDDLWIVKSLLQNGAHVNSLNIYHETPLVYAISFHLDIIKELLNWCADVHVRNTRLRTCLHIAAWYPNIFLFLELLKRGACIECFDKDGLTVLDIILLSRRPKRLEETKALIETAILVNKGNRTNFSLIEKNYILLEFVEECVEECAEEVDRMKSIQLAKDFSLLDFALQSDCESSQKCSIEKIIFDKVLKTLINFPIYNDYIGAHFQRSYLREKLFGMNIYGIYTYLTTETTKTIEVYLNSYIMDHICSFLANEDLLKFLKTFTESTPRSGK